MMREHTHWHSDESTVWIERLFFNVEDRQQYVLYRYEEGYRGSTGAMGMLLVSEFTERFQPGVLDQDILFRLSSHQREHFDRFIQETKAQFLTDQRKQCSDCRLKRSQKKGYCRVHQQEPGVELAWTFRRLGSVERVSLLVTAMSNGAQATTHADRSCNPNT